MRELCLHILDIAANSVSAGADRVSISIDENLQDDLLTIQVEDNGKGMSAETVESIIDPFTTSRTERNVGLGIPLLKHAAESCDGWLSIKSKLGEGTQITVQFKHSHIDRMPLGNIADTLSTLVLGTPDINWVFTVKRNEKEFSFDDQEIKRELGGVSITEPEVIRFIRSYFVESIQEVQDDKGESRHASH
ncbi:MAG: sensor histidine kinase [Chloroflexi bacterium]|nr:sensor histidine kinase [Chloroflexota bacterium]